MFALTFPVSQQVSFKLSVVNSSKPNFKRNLLFDPSLQAVFFVCLFSHLSLIQIFQEDTLWYNLHMAETNMKI